MMKSPMGRVTPQAMLATWLNWEGKKDQKEDWKRKKKTRKKTRLRRCSVTWGGNMAAAPVLGAGHNLAGA